MGTKNIKIIDEHGIDRNGTVMCAIDVDGSDYLVYYIERDNDNDNVFVSTLIKDVDNTSNLINIEDGVEKEKISIIVKDLIKYSIENENSKLNSKYISLASGKNVEIINAIINREQNINVPKTYITTVKKNVTKVSSDFLNFAFEESVDSTVTSTVEPVNAEAPSAVEPVPVAVQPEVVQPVVEPVAEVPPVVEPIAPVEPIAASVVEQPVVVPEVPEISLPVVEPVVAQSASQPVASAPAVEATPVEPATPVVEVTPAVSNPLPSESKSANTDLVFDASKESNLNTALGDSSSGNSSVAVSSVEPIREFGVETPVAAGTPVTEPVPAATKLVLSDIPETVTPQVGTVNNGDSSKSGFANNKFFMVIAIVFFLSSCIFLGYEAFNYFQIK